MKQFWNTSARALSGLRNPELRYKRHKRVRKKEAGAARLLPQAPFPYILSPLRLQYNGSASFSRQHVRFSYHHMSLPSSQPYLIFPGSAPFSSAWLLPQCELKRPLDFFAY